MLPTTNEERPLTLKNFVPVRCGSIYHSHKMLWIKKKNWISTFMVRLKLRQNKQYKFVQNKRQIQWEKWNLTFYTFVFTFSYLSMQTICIIIQQSIELTIRLQCMISHTQLCFETPFCAMFIHFVWVKKEKNDEQKSFESFVATS